MKLTNDQIESIRAVSPELAEKLEAGEKVTIEKAVEKWEPKRHLIDYIEASKEGPALAKLLAYRDEFAPGYVVPESGGAWTPCLDEDGMWKASLHTGVRYPWAIYFPEDICRDLCRKLNSGEVVL